ncbi:sulfite reductase flavoprotein subunit alpha [Acidovorax sp. PRC11]|nr:sulfite reductase flavoprotein subunit alpha [Acidovorax sp. PRC11]MDT0136642.1 sulfite reductase flavoprotein subunit alpha [Acidovorax sp. PRC11]
MAIDPAQPRAAPVRPPVPTPSVAPGLPRRAFAWPGLRAVLFQLHWFIGITAGTVLVVIGLSGALLAFREEILDLINPGVRQVAPQAGPALTPPQLVEALARSDAAGRRINTVTVQSAPGAAPRIGFAARAGERRGEAVYLNPYTGAVQPALRGDDAFEWVESLHRWLLLPREPGRIAAGTLALCLLGLSLSGLVLRWPRNPLRWRTWLAFDTRLKGRPFLWSLHAVAGTWALVVYVVLTATGLYWSFDAVRDTVDGWAGQPRPARTAMAPGARGTATPAGTAKAGAAPGSAPDLAPAWQAFAGRAPDWKTAVLRLPQRADQPLQILWLDHDAPHDRARHRMLIDMADGAITTDDRYGQRSAGARALTTIYPLHLGTYFGLPGRIAVTAASLALPLFAVTGWMLYLGRRRQRRAADAARHAAEAIAPHLANPANPADARAGERTLLVAYASQAGTAERLALQTASALQRAGLPAQARPLQDLAPHDLAGHARVLLVASSFGEGEAPDAARRFMRALQQGPAAGTAPLAAVRHALLALGDRHYAHFCGFGHALDAELRRWGAEPLFPLIEVDDGDPAALARWHEALAALDGVQAWPVVVAPTATEAPAALACHEPWRLEGRTLLNPGSLGGPLVEITLRPAGPEAATTARWQPGALVDIAPRQPAEAVAAWLQACGLDGLALVRHPAGQAPLADVLARSVLPTLPLPPGIRHPQACADALTPLAPRTYSIASLPEDGALQLLVRQERHAQGLGIASGWLTAHAPQGSVQWLRFVENPRFGPDDTDGRPCLFIGNGSGLAGLRAHLRARVRAGQRNNWLLFGERQRAADSLCAAEIGAWQAQGFLPRLDRVFSRDPGAPHRYVQDALREHAMELRAWLDDGAVVFVCGSAEGMAAGVDRVLADLLGDEGVEALIADGRYRRDVY